MYMTSNYPKLKKLGATFHRTFSLSRSVVADILDVAEIAENEGVNGLPSKFISQHKPHLGSEYLTSMPRYAVGCGLIDDKTKRLTQFGRATRKNDVKLTKPDTQWLMHFFLSWKDGPGASYWNELVTHLFVEGTEFTRLQMIALMTELRENGENTIPSVRDTDQCLAAFYGTYTKSEALGNLGILQLVDSSIGAEIKKFLVDSGTQPSCWVIGYALSVYWDFMYPTRISINASELFGQASLSSLFMTSIGRMNRYIHDLQMEGYYDYYRTAPPFQVVRLSDDIESLLQHIYGNIP